MGQGEVVSRFYRPWWVDRSAGTKRKSTRSQPGSAVLSKRPLDAKIVGLKHKQPGRTHSLAAPAGRAAFLATPVAVFLVIAMVSLWRSMEIGRLSMPPYYDDVVYLFWSQLVMHSAAHQSFFATAYQMIDQHSPLTTIFGVAGYSLVPTGELGPYIVGSLHILLYLFA